MEPMMASIMMFGGNFAPRGWAFCNGQLLAISANTALFSLIGTTYGGDGRTTFALPDLRGRVAIHSANGENGPGLSSYRLGQRSGVEYVILNQNQIPSHTHAHTFNVSSEQATISTPTDHASLAAPGTNDGRSFSPVFGYNTETPDTTLNPSSVVLGNTGGNQSHTNIQPYLAINYIIAMQGFFPSRN